MGLSVLPDFTVTKDLFDKGLSLDKRNNPHHAATLRAFQWVNLVDTLNERRPRHATFATVCSIQLRYSGQRRHNRLFCLLCHPPFLVRIPTVITNLMFTFVGDMLRNFG